MILVIFWFLIIRGPPVLITVTHEHLCLMLSFRFWLNYNVPRDLGSRMGLPEQE